MAMQNPDPQLHPCGQCAFYSKSVWQPVTGNMVGSLAHSFKRTDISKDNVLWEQGSENTGVVCVSRGLIALRSLDQNGKSTLLSLAYPGEIIGIRSFLTGRSHQTEATAILPSRVCVVSQSRANQIVKGNTEVLSRLATRCIEEIDRNHERIISNATKSNKEQLAALLHRLMDAHGVRDGDAYRMKLPLSRPELADLIGVRPETLSRLVTRFEKDEGLEIKGREVRMLVRSHQP